MATSYNLRSPAVKRLMKEAQELHEATELYHAQPLEDNLFEWHFTIRGPDDSDFEGGIYHGRIILPTEYPMKPPNIVLLTPNGRFEVGTKVCLSISGYHPETWLPSWSIRTALLALIGFYPSPSNGAIGGLDYDRVERQKLARKSASWRCEICGEVAKVLKPHVPAPKPSNSNADPAPSAVTPSLAAAADSAPQSSAADQSNAASSSEGVNLQHQQQLPTITGNSDVHQRIQSPFSFSFAFVNNGLPSIPLPTPMQMAMPMPMVFPMRNVANGVAAPGYPPDQVLAEWRAYCDNYFASSIAGTGGAHPSTLLNHVLPLSPVHMQMMSGLLNPAFLAANNFSAPNSEAASTSTSAPTAAPATTPNQNAAAIVNREPVVGVANQDADNNVNGNRPPEAENLAEIGLIDSLLVNITRVDWTGLLLRVCLVFLAILLFRRALIVVLDEDDVDEL